MRKSLLFVTQDIRRELKNEDRLREVANDMVPVELMAVACELLELDLPLNESWVLLTGYDEPVLPEGIDKSILIHLRQYMTSFSAESSWHRLLEQYQAIEESFQLVRIHEDFTYTFQTPSIVSDRKSIYQKLLSEPVPYRKTPKRLAKAGKFRYKKKDVQFYENKEGEIPSHWVEPYDTLPESRKKQEIVVPADFDWMEVAKEMDALDPSGNWQKRYEPIWFESIDPQEKAFKFKGLKHVVGGLSAGKSTFSLMNTFWLVKEKGAKVALVERSVAEVLERAEQLRAFGFNVAPIIGASNRKGHFHTYMTSEKVQNFNDLTDERLSHISGICTLHALTEDYSTKGSSFYPCEQIYTDGKTSKICPLIHNCGVFKDLANLLEADVWITTSAALLKTKLPATIDPFKRTVYEAMYDLIDVIFVDEADEVQKQFEENFLNEYDAFGKVGNVSERLLEQYHEQIVPDVRLQRNVHMIKWRESVLFFHFYVQKVFDRIASSKQFRKLITDKIIYLNYLIHDIAQSIKRDDNHYKEIKSHLLTFTKYILSEDDEGEDVYLEQILDTSDREDLKEHVRSWVSSQQGILPAKDEEFERLIYRLDLFVHLANIEVILKYIQRYYPIIRQYVSIEDIPELSVNRDFRPFVKEAMTAVIFGYRYEKQPGEDFGHFKVVQYTSVGRDLLYNWPYLYEAADEREGPSVVLLSGTSYAPESFHYHIEHGPSWLLTSDKQTSTITQEFLPIFDPEHPTEMLHVSGVPEEYKRQRNLETIVQELEFKINQQLMYWNNQGENRKVLLVVNSYDDVKTVGHALQRIKQFQGRYRLLSRDKKQDDIHYPRSMIERYAHADPDADILVVPMLAINRGYNILRDQKAHFGSVFFLVRPYPVPNDLSYFVQMLHGKLPDLFTNIKRENKQFVEAMRYIRSESRGDFENMYRVPDFWSILSEAERTVLAWYTFTPTWQLIGRLLRGGSNANVFYCDAKFMYGRKDEQGLLHYWQKIMTENDDKIFNSLYGPFKKSILSLEKGEIYV